MNLLVALKVFGFFLLPLPGVATSAIILYGWSNGLNSLTLVAIYILNSVTVVSVGLALVKWIFGRPLIQTRLIKKTKGWRKKTEGYLGRYGIALGLLLASYFIGWWISILAGRILAVRHKTVWLMAVLGDVLYFITYLVLAMGTRTVLSTNPRLYVYGILLVSVIFGFIVKQIAGKIERRK